VGSTDEKQTRAPQRSMSIYSQFRKGMLRRFLESGQYLSTRYSEQLSEGGIEPSVGSVGNSYDNALAESVIGLFKTEVVRRRGLWHLLRSVEFATLEWVDCFNNRRLLEPIGNLTPVEFEMAYYQRQDSPVFGGWTHVENTPGYPGRFSQKKPCCCHNTFCMISYKKISNDFFACRGLTYQSKYRSII
jgi:hypothetical protein